MIVAAGARTPQLAKTLDWQASIQPGKGYSLGFLVQMPPKTPIIFEDSHVAVTPLETALAIGTTMELAGYDETINRRRIGMSPSRPALTFLSRW